VRTAKIILISSIFVSSSTMLAQNVLRIEIIGGASLNSTAEGALSGCGNGWSIGAGSAYRIAKGIDLAADAVYHRYPYRGLHIVAPAVYGYGSSVSGQASSVVEGSIAVRFFSSNSCINPFLSLRTGLYFISIGEVVESYWLDSDPQNVYRSTIHGTGISTIKGFGSVGLGFSIPMGSRIGVLFEGRITETFDLEEFIIPLQATIQIGL
jgi:hypothetical protein